MKIEFIENYKSFKKGEVFYIENFTIITGENGTGKTNFLKSIYSRHESIVMINGKIGKEINQNYYYHHSFSANSANSSNNLNVSIQSDLNQNSHWVQYQSWLEGDEVQEFWISGFNSIAKTTNKNVKELTANDFMAVVPNHRITNNNYGLFEIVFYEDFANYISSIKRNKYNHFLNEEYGESNLVFNEKSFKEKFGLPPWDIVNKILDETSLPYRCNIKKNIKNISRIKTVLKDIRDGSDVEISDLSSGEKIILSIISMVYNLEKTNSLPEILLFDEPDALLHPSYSKILLDILYKYLVLKHNRKVILVTHSPSTVAIAPPESIYLCSKVKSKIKKVTKDEALGRLTVNLNSLSIAHKNRRQVFVEDKNDSILFELIKDRIMTELHDEISLNFIPVSIVGAEGIGGKDAVRKVVNTLRGYGNNQIFGIIDYDNINNSTDSIYVLGENERYSIESYILDPIYIVAFLLRERILLPSDFKLNKNFTYVDLKQLPPNQLQSISDSVIELLKELRRDHTGNRYVNVSYLNKSSIDVPKWFFQVNGHKLVTFLEKKFPKIIGIKKDKSQDLLKLFMNTVLRELPGYISTDFVELFRKIQKYY